MAYYSKKDCFLYCSGYNLGPYMETIGAKQSSPVDEWRPLGSDYLTRTYTGEDNAEVTMAGLYETTSTAVVGAKPDSTSRVWVAGFETDDESKRFWGFRSAAVSEGELVMEEGKVHRISPVLTISGAHNEGYIVAPLTARTTAGNTQATYADMGASAGVGIASAFLIVTSITLGGYTNLVVTPQSCDTPAGTYLDETAFTAVTAAGGQCITLAGVVERYLAIQWVWTGAGSGMSWTGFVGVARD